MRCRSRALLPLLITPIVMAACTGGGRTEFIQDGTYSGVDSAGNEIQLTIAGNTVNVGGVKTDVDDTAVHLTFDESDAAHEHWVCVPIDQGISCRVTWQSHRQTIQLTQI